MRITRLALAAALLAAPAAADPIEDAIEARQGFFTLLGANIKPLAGMAKGEIDYDAATAELHAGNLATMAGYNPLLHFPEGSDGDERFGETDALPAIWANLDDFAQKREDFAAAAMALAEVAGDGRGALGPAVGKLGGTCKACHDEYRSKD